MIGVVSGQENLEGDWSNALDEHIHTEIKGGRVYVTGQAWTSWYSPAEVENLIRRGIWRPL